MDLRGFEFYAITGNPVVGAQVNVRAASLTHPNPNPIVGTANSDGSGMWEITGLPEGAYDADVTISGKYWRHKGLSMTSLGGIYISGAPYNPINWLRNGGLEYWPGGAGPQAITTTPNAAFQPPYSISIGTGSAATIAQETTITSTGSASSAKVAYTHSSGSYKAEVTLSGALLSALRGKTVVFQGEVRQGTASQAALYIYDGTTTTVGSRSATTGSFVTLSVSVAIPANATALKFGILADVSGTFYYDNLMFATGTSIGQFIPHILDDTSYTWAPPGFNADLLDGLSSAAFAQLAAGVGVNNFTNNILIAGAANWHAGNDGTGSLLDADLLDGLNSSAFLQLAVGGTITEDIAIRRSATPTTGYIFYGNAGTNFLGYNGSGFVINGNALWHGGNDGAGSTLDADLLDGQQGSFYAPITSPNFQGTPTIGGAGIWTTANDGPGNGLDADTVDGVHASSFAQLATANAYTSTATYTVNVPAGSGFPLSFQNTADPGYSIGCINAAGSVWDFLLSHAALVINVPTQLASGSTMAGQTIWHAGNDGSGTGLDADLLDGIQSTGFVRTTGGTMTGQLVVNQSSGLSTIHATNGGGGYAIEAVGALRVNGDISGTGMKGRIATGHDGTKGFFHANETPLPVFEEYGHARLTDGEAWVDIPQDYANYVDLDDYEVFLTPLGRAVLYVSERTPIGFVVQSIVGDNVEFSWRVLARQSDLRDVKRQLPLGES